MQLTIAQQNVRPQLAENKAKIIAILGQARPGDWVIFPECALTGYFPGEAWFLQDIDPAAIAAALIRPDYALRQGAKAIIVRAKISGEGKKYIMLVMPADQRFSTSKAKKALHCKDMRFATEEEVEAITDGVKPGGVPPFGNLFGLPIVTDPALYSNETIIFNAGRNCSIAVKSADYRQLVQPMVADII